MSPRPRTLADADILAGAGRVLARVGPARLTLADVAAEVGLAPATLVQRFGSRRGLLLALAEHGARRVADDFAAARSATSSPLAALIAALISMTRDVSTPEALANSLAFLQIDLSDPDFHGFALAHADATEAEIRVLLDAAVNAGELASSDTARLARALLVAYNGSLVVWAIRRDGSLADRLRDDLEMLLRPFRPSVPPTDGGERPVAERQDLPPTVNG